MPELNDIVEELKKGVNAIIKSATEIGKDGIDDISGFSERQLNGIADQSLLIGEGLKNKDLTTEEAKTEFEDLSTLAKNFANTLVGLLAITIEKIWNAMVKILSGVIKSIAGLVL